MSEEIYYFEVKGMTCQGCVKSVSRAVQETGIADVDNIDLGSGLMQVAQGSKNLTEKEFIDRVSTAVQKKGYKIKYIPDSDIGDETHKWNLSLWVSALATLFIFFLSLGGMSAWEVIVALVLATIIQFYGALSFYTGAWNKLKEKQFNVDSLVVLSSSAAYFTSLWYFIFLRDHHPHYFFLEAGSIVSLISLGHYLEHKVLSRADKTLRSLLALAPEKARRLNSQSGQEEVVDVSELKIGDLISLRAGDRVPVDGEIQEGEGTFDESSLTGETFPVFKTVGSGIYAGTINKNASLKVKVTALGKDSALQKIVASLKRLQNSQSKIQGLADRISNVFVPIVILLSLVLFLIWGFFPETLHSIQAMITAKFHIHFPEYGPWQSAFLIAIGVLIISCPCALGLATPAALMAGSNLAAKEGILIKDAKSLENSRKITHVLFDKTGTLTTGEFEIVADRYRDDRDSKKVNHLAACLAANSTHPLSQVISQLSKDHEQGWKVEEFPEGVQGKSSLNAEVLYRLGSENWFKELSLSAKLPQEFVEEEKKKGRSVLFFFQDEIFLAAFSLQDKTKAKAKSVLNELKSLNVEILLLTGDHEEVAQDLAHDLGLKKENVYAQLKPEDKLKIIESLEEQNSFVAFVGDGINDALALQKADLGISLSKASHIAQQSADIVLLNTDIESVPRALRISKKTLQVIKQNLFWAFFYNVIAIPLAAFGVLSPIICAFAMGFSDFFVVINSLRLLRYKE